MSPNILLESSLLISLSWASVLSPFLYYIFLDMPESHHCLVISVFHNVRPSPHAQMLWQQTPLLMSFFKTIVSPKMICLKHLQFFTMLISMAALTSYHKLRSLKQWLCVTSQFGWFQVQLGSTGYSGLNFIGWNQSFDWLGSSEILGKIYYLTHSGYWYNSVPWGCRNEIPISLLAVTWNMPLTQKFHAFFLMFCPLSYQQWDSEYVSHLKSLWLPFYHIFCVSFSAFLLCFPLLLMHLENQNNFLILKSADAFYCIYLF